MLLCTIGPTSSDKLIFHQDQTSMVIFCAFASLRLIEAAEIASRNGMSQNESVAKAHAVFDIPCASVTLILLINSRDIEDRSGTLNSKSSAQDQAVFDSSGGLNSEIIGSDDAASELNKGRW
jgi:hypothetical protein